MLAGEITAEIGGEVVVAVAGSYVLKPYGVMHALWNATNQPARVMELHLPGGFEQFYVDMTAVASDDSLDQHARTEQMKAARGPSVHTHRLQQHPVDLHPDCSSSGIVPCRARTRHGRTLPRQTSRVHSGVIVDQWDALVAELATTPDVVDRLLAEHVPDDSRRCRACTRPGLGTPMKPWPCGLYKLAMAAKRQGPLYPHR